MPKFWGGSLWVSGFGGVPIGWECLALRDSLWIVGGQVLGGGPVGAQVWEGVLWVPKFRGGGVPMGCECLSLGGPCRLWVSSFRGGPCGL